MQFYNNILSFSSYDSSGVNLNNNIPLMSTASCDGVWRHFALVCTFRTPSVSTYVSYVNTVQDTTFNGYCVKNATRTSNFIGKSNAADGTITMSLDDFRLYSRALTPSEIKTVYDSSVFL